jgi:hypothetical protein
MPKLSTNVVGVALSVHPSRRSYGGDYVIVTRTADRLVLGLVTRDGNKPSTWLAVATDRATVLARGLRSMDEAVTFLLAQV